MKILAENKRARFDYEIRETYEAGIELGGYEVKSVKQGRMQIAGSYAVLRNKEVWLLNTEIPAYQPKNAPQDYDTKRTRRLLLHIEEIQGLIGKLHEKGVALLPLRVLLVRGFIKIELGLGRAKKTRDKRDLIKRRGAEREMRLER